MAKKRTYRVTAAITISLNAEVKARSLEEAERLAVELRLPTLCAQCGADQGNGVWSTSGEFDGEPQDIEIETDE